MKLSGTIKALISYDEDNLQDFDISILENSIPIPEIDTPILNLVIKYCEYHYQTKDNDDEKKKWDEEYIKLEDDLLFQLILAANYLEITPLLDLTCATVANYIKACTTPQEVRRRFNIENDFTNQEMEVIEKENAWCNDK